MNNAHRQVVAPDEVSIFRILEITWSDDAPVSVGAGQIRIDIWVSVWLPGSYFDRWILRIIEVYHQE